MSVRISLAAISAAGIAVLVACNSADVTSTPRAGDAALRAASSSVELLQCPSTGTASATGLVSALGGVVSAGGVTIAIPAGALLGTSQVTVTVPDSRLLEVDISVAGQEHFTFELPVVVTMSYARCSRANIDKGPLSAWYIDSETKAPLENMGGIDNKLLRTVTFTTGHLSGYAIAN